MTEPSKTLSENQTKKPLYKRVWFWIIVIPIALGVIGLLHGPGGMDKVNEQQAGEQTASNGPSSATASSDQDLPVTCDSSDAASMVKDALESSSSTLETVKVLDFGKAQETYYDKVGKVRGCKADAELSAGGGQLVTYQLYFGPSGKALARVETGDQAEMTVETDPNRKAAIAARDELLEHPSTKAQDASPPAAAAASDQQAPAQPASNEQPPAQDGASTNGTGDQPRQPVDQPQQNDQSQPQSAQPAPNNQ